MRLEEYRKIYDEVSLSKEADERILQALQEAQSSGKKRNSSRVRAVRIAVAAAVLVLAVGIMKFPAVASTTKTLVTGFTNFVLNSGESSQEDIEKMEKRMEGVEYGYPTSVYEYSDSGEYLEINPDAPKKECKMDSMDAVSEMLGIDLLQSKDAYQQENCILYTPYVSESGALNGAVLIDDFYALGDIREAEYSIFPEVETSNAICYRPGEKYQSPIRMEITMRTDDAEGVDYDNHELDYGGRIEAREDNDAEKTENYVIQNLGGVNAMLSLDETDGVSTWGKLEGEEISSCVSAYFLYQGVEYRYVGAVSLETMQEFLEGLEIA